MNGTKPFYQSTGVVGAVFTILLAIAALCGIPITPENKPIIGALALLIGTGFMSLMGRLKANTTIGGKTDVTLADVMELLERLPMGVAKLCRPASGGVFKPGMRIVGESGPEQEPLRNPVPAMVLNKDGMAESLAGLLTAVQSLVQAPSVADLTEKATAMMDAASGQPNEPNTSTGGAS